MIKHFPIIDLGRRSVRSILCPWNEIVTLELSFSFIADWIRHGNSFVANCLMVCLFFVVEDSAGVRSRGGDRLRAAGRRLRTGRVRALVRPTRAAAVVPAVVTAVPRPPRRVERVLFSFVVRVCCFFPTTSVAHQTKKETKANNQDDNPTSPLRGRVWPGRNCPSSPAGNFQTSPKKRCR